MVFVSLGKEVLIFPIFLYSNAENYVMVRSHYLSYTPQLVFNLVAFRICFPLSSYK